MEVVDDLDAARQAVLDRIPHKSSVMTNTSVTLQETGIADAINDGGRIYQHSLVLEDARAIAAYGQHSSVGKVAVFGDAVADADIVVLAIPLHRFLDIDPALLDGKLVVDAMNYSQASDGVLTAFEDGGSSEIVARRLAGSAVVKALNHIGYHELEGRTRPAGAPDRRAAGVAGDDPAAVAAIAGLVDRIGYNPVRLESLRAGRVLQPGGPVFGVTLTRPELRTSRTPRKPCTSAHPKPSRRRSPRTSAPWTPPGST